MYQQQSRDLWVRHFQFQTKSGALQTLSISVVITVVVLSLKLPVNYHFLDSTTNRSGKLFKGALAANGNFFHGIRNSQSTTRTTREMMARVWWTANRWWWLRECTFNYTNLHSQAGSYSRLPRKILGLWTRPPFYTATDMNERVLIPNFRCLYAVPGTVLGTFQQLTMLTGCWKWLRRGWKGNGCVGDEWWQ